VRHTNQNRGDAALASTGRSVTVEGVAYVHVKSSAAFVDMGGDFPNQTFQAVIFPNRQAAFGDLNRFNGKTDDVTGPVRDYTRPRFRNSIGDPMPDIIDARDAENESRKQRIGLAYLLRIDESKARNSADIMIMRRIKAAAIEKKSKEYDALLADSDVNQLFNASAIYFER
jgi:hypothetical protein